MQEYQIQVNYVSGRKMVGWFTQFEIRNGIIVSTPTKSDKKPIEIGTACIESVWQLQVREVEEDDVHIMGEEPTRCSLCGVRTEWYMREDSRQQHNCPQCGNTFILEEDDEQ